MVAPDVGLLLAGAAAGSISGIAQLFFPQFIAVALDRRALPFGLAALVLGVLCLEGAGRFGEKYLFQVAGQRSVLRLRRRLFEHLLRQEVGYFDEQRSGDLTSRIMTDVQSLEAVLLDEVGPSIRAVVVVAGTSFVLMRTSPLLTLFAVLALVPFALLLHHLGRRVQVVTAGYQERVGEVASVASETLGGIRTIRAYDQEAGAARRFRAALEHGLRVGMRYTLIHGLTRGISSVGSEIAAVVVLIIAAPMVVAGTLSTGNITAFVITGVIGMSALRDIAICFTEIRRVRGALQRVTDLLDREPLVPVEGGAMHDPIEGRVDFEHVSFRYPSRPAVPVLENVDLAISPGQIVALVGTSGAGKSTLVSLLLRFYEAEQGRVLIDGRDTRTLDGRWLRRRIAFVAQDSMLLSATVEENIRFGREDASFDEVCAAARTANAYDFIASFPQGFATVVGERGVQLSGGQRQRIAIARAVLKDPRILVLDEATSALDAESEALVQQAVERVMKGRTTLVVAHRLSTVRAADRVVVLDRGRIVESGTHDSLKGASGLYSQLVSRQMLVD
jgi:ATP-binding cassette subfamily B protein